MFKEKFIIHSTMNQEEILKKVKEGLEIKPRFFGLAKGDFTGKINGHKFEIIIWHARHYEPTIKGEIRGSSIAIELYYDKLSNYAILMMLLLICFIFAGALLFVIKFGLDYKTNEKLVGPIIALFLLPCLTFGYFDIIKSNFRWAKESLKKLFNGTIEKQP